MPGTSDSVKVAVRVRPFNQREKNAGSKCILSMKDKSTTIKNPDTGETKTFAYDHSYWSHDGYTETPSGVYEQESPSSQYTDQKCLFQDLGQGVLDNAWQGYNAALFAYGQTGSGKSYSMIGYGPNKGIVPITCEELFKVIGTNEDGKKQLRVFFSMLEIYNEQVRDLLLKGKPPHGGLKIRQNPKQGFYVEGLKQVPVRSYSEIEKLMESGTFNRTTASTNMNATSSRSHMVITIRFEQVIQGDSGQSNTRSSDINLVDLAGSERADSTGATGDRLKEGSAINQSLSTLGNVISALADIAMGKKKVLVPYRDSVLTKLLQSALGGNSRTIMIAALSPADINYDETLSTMRYADRAKKIQNKAVVNESPTDRLIRELKEENARLMAMLKKQGTGDTTDIQSMLADNQRKMVDMQMSWQQRLEQARQEWEKSHHIDGSVIDKEWMKHPYITNVNEDPQLSGVIKHCFSKKCTFVGRSGSEDAIQLRGLGIEPEHIEVNVDGDKTFIKPCKATAAVFVNGIKVHEQTQLKHQDRLKLGSASLFLYIGYPEERGNDGTTDTYDYNYFMLELAEHAGVSVDIATPRDTHHTDDLSHRVLFQDFVDLLPKLAEANAISEELKRYTKFEAVVRSEASHDPKGTAAGKEVIIKVTNNQTKKVWIWSMNKFYNRKDLMDELYLKWLDGYNVVTTRDNDPFWDPVEDIFLGSCHIMLQSIGYCAEVDEHFTLHNYHGKEEAVIHVQLLPCDEKGHALEDDIVMEPKDLLNKTLNFTCVISQCMSVRWISEDHLRGVECRFTLPFQKPTKTKTVWHKGYVEFDFRQIYKYKPVTQKLLDYLHNNSLVLELWGKQVSEDEQLHSDGMPHADIETERLTKHQKTKLKEKVIEYRDDELMYMEDEAEMLREECEQIRKENFKLKQTVMVTEEKLRLLEMRGGLKRVGNKDRNMGASKTASSQTGLDVDFAKALRDFFQEMKDIQNGFKEMREFVTSTKDKIGANGIRQSFENHEHAINAIDDKMTDCLASLKKSAATALRKSRSGPDK
ncbi:kinesin-like protein KIF28 isoform X2 [Mercenaria mercenaria]|uniref:kinesin-like protein KIF28 isoform X2 n=1 Tax=Mercenaria mercenaria TaxID=6596 RepID=UPI00234F1CD1|nr:kinesin-like protein KIF28 isoform X2 [Mercenaria mercenaria]